MASGTKIIPPHGGSVVAADGFDAKAALRRVAEVGLVGGVIVAVNAATGFGIPCPFLATFGVQCPFCGSTRSASALLHGDLAAAWAFNPLFLVALVLVAIAAIAWTVEVVGGPKLRPPAAIRPLTQSKIYWVLFVVALTFTVLRNIW